MAYEAKTDWKYGETPTEGDANRWEQGIKDAHDGLDNIEFTAEATSIEDAEGLFESDNVEGALSETAQKLTMHKAESATGAHKATNISFAPSSGMTAINVQSAILESFTAGNSRKEELVDALLLLDPSLPINYNSSWQEILDASGQVSTGKKWASGTVTSSSSPLNFQHAGSTTTASVRYVEVTDLPFKPKVIIITGEAPNSRYLTVYAEGSDSFYPKTVKHAIYNAGVLGSQQTYNLKADIAPAYVTETGFLLPYNIGVAQATWEIWGE